MHHGHDHSPTDSEWWKGAEIAIAVGFGLSCWIAMRMGRFLGDSIVDVLFGVKPKAKPEVEQYPDGKEDLDGR